MNRNFNIKKYLITGTILTIGFLFSPLLVQATTGIYFDIEEAIIYEGDTFIVEMKISSPDKSINVIEGTILYDNKNLEIKEISTGESLFTLWPKLPVFSNEKGNLSFVGGSISGFQGENGEILKIVSLAKNAGETKIDFLDDFSVLLNDGYGTKINPWLTPLSLNILTRSVGIPTKDEWQDLIEKDKVPPEFIETIISSDPHIFDNQYFVSFFAIDKESGIDYYEIKEGNLDFVQTESPHLLQNQSLKGIVQIKAVDKAGNESITSLKSSPVSEISYKTYLIWIAIVLAIVFTLRWLWKTKSKNNLQNKK
jgi:hypothetical protein